MVRISVTVDREHLPVIADVAAALSARGMVVEQVLPLGFITGSVPEERRGTLGAIEGVESVDDQLDYGLPSPDEDIQ